MRFALALAAALAFPGLAAADGHGRYVKIERPAHHPLYAGGGHGHGYRHVGGGSVYATFPELNYTGTYIGNHPTPQARIISRRFTGNKPGRYPLDMTRAQAAGPAVTVEANESFIAPCPTGLRCIRDFQ